MSNALQHRADMESRPELPPLAVERLSTVRAANNLLDRLSHDMGLDPEQYREAMAASTEYSRQAPPVMPSMVELINLHEEPVVDTAGIEAMQREVHEQETLAANADAASSVPAYAGPAAPPAYISHQTETVSAAAQSSGSILEFPAGFDPNRVPADTYSIYGNPTPSTPNVPQTPAYGEGAVIAPEAWQGQDDMVEKAYRMLEAA